LVFQFNAKEVEVQSPVVELRYSIVRVEVGPPVMSMVTCRFFPLTEAVEVETVPPWFLTLMVATPPDISQKLA